MTRQDRRERILTAILLATLAWVVTVALARACWGAELPPCSSDPARTVPQPPEWDGAALVVHIHQPFECRPWWQTYQQVGNVYLPAEIVFDTCAHAFAGLSPFGFAVLWYETETEQRAVWVLTRGSSWQSCYTTATDNRLSSVDLGVEADGFALSVHFPGATTAFSDGFESGDTSAWSRTINPCTVDCDIFSDGFESGDLSAWSEVVP